MAEDDASAPTSLVETIAMAERGRAADLSRGELVGRYVVLGRIGAGGMGVVYAAYDPELDRKVALKLLLRGRGDGSPEQRSRMLREAQALAKLSHPNVVAVYDVGTVAGDVYLAMEFVEGRTLSGWLAQGGRPWRATLEVLRRAGEGLAAAHACGIIHRDFKPVKSRGVVRARKRGDTG